MEFRYEQDPTVSASNGPTPSQTVGPFFGFALPYSAGPDLVGGGRDGAIRLAGRVLDGAGEPLPDAMVEIWQPDETGRLDAAGILHEVAGDDFRGFGRCATEPDGSYAFRTVKPAAVPAANGVAQAPYIAMAVFARGLLRPVATRVYFADEAAANASDPLLSALDPDRRATLVAESVGGGYRFDVRLQGDDETVFLDVFAY